MRSRMRGERSSRRPLTTMRTPRLCISSISRSIVSWNRRISARTSARGRALLLHLLDPVQLVSAHVPNRDARLLGLLLHELDVLAPPLLGQRRDGHADDLAVVGRIQALVARPQRLFDRADLALVVDLD